MPPARAIPVVRDFAIYVSLFRSAPDAARQSPDALRNHLVVLLEEVDQRGRLAGIAEEEIELIRFALLAFADEMLANSQWAGADEWKREPQVRRMLGIGNAGNVFFERLQALGKQQTAAREVFFLCLALGFQGELGVSPGELQTLLQQNLERLLRDGAALRERSLDWIAEPAYDVEIKNIRPQKQRSLWLPVASVIAATALLYGALHAALYFTAQRIPGT